ncbi:Nicotinate-nucleotide--dimethylbenzimidazole phosphoribosyltransferase [Fusobacterium necrogenes]|uniref:Nicotinate-nucleotide--dimethylbenzimidazole phosphoribosyltransferase n=1 Tax=Fusobacterium necrogenes TaxID=858 RepID=A0A377GWV3_9FUSO|nr:nicotinate-nucleotide--dimethylbenzimidazole phosphoribosyltransferase [Fusobacterium necrogenes]STO31094.1 Nicotinate-nucleotide--dimethylbenzimidazole phosphoribosyltransferase [Fusobacterium necrogenes]
MIDVKRKEDIIGKLDGLDVKSMQLIQKILDSKMKPQGSLGALEKIAVKMAGIYGYPLERVEKRCHIVASADNGIVAEGISSCPREYTTIVSEAMLNKVACIGLFCERLGIDFNLVDIGMKESISRDYSNLYNKNIKKGTNNFYKEPAMSRKECLSAIHEGMNMIKEKAQGITVFSNGEMGIGNTTTSSAVLYSLTKKDIDKIVGRGGGLSDIGLSKKKSIIKKSCERYNTFEMSPIDILAHVGGLDIAYMVGLYLGSVKYRKLMLVDGFISAVAFLSAYRIEPKVKDFSLFTHMSEEPGMQVILDEIGESALFNLNMRLGEGTGAVLAYPLIDCALDIVNGMKTIEEVYEMFK